MRSIFEIKKINIDHIDNDKFDELMKSYGYSLIDDVYKN